MGKHLPSSRAKVLNSPDEIKIGVQNMYYLSRRYCILMAHSRSQIGFRYGKNVNIPTEKAMVINTVRCLHIPLRTHVVPIKYCTTRLKSSNYFV